MSTEKDPRLTPRRAVGAGLAAAAVVAALPRFGGNGGGASSGKPQGDPRALGPDHPETLSAISIRGALSTDPVRAEALLGSACERLSTLHPMEPNSGWNCWAELGYVALTLGARDRAAVAFGRAESVHAKTQVGDAVPGAYQALLEGRPREAVTRFEAELKEPLKPDDPTWTRLTFASAEAGLGEALRILGSTAEARAHLERAVAIFTGMTAQNPNPPFVRGLAHARAQLALTTK